jgi:hypothetical protein
VTTSEHHRRNPRDDEHVRRICALRPEIAASLGLAEHTDALPDPGAEGRAALLEANLAWRKDLESQATDSRERLLDARVFSASLELFRFSDEELALWRHDVDDVGPVADALLLQLRGIVPGDAEQGFDAIARRLRGFRPWLVRCRQSATSHDVFAPSTELTLRARDVVDGMPDLLRAVLDAARGLGADGGDARPLPASLLSSLEAAVDDASGALDEHVTWLTGLPTQPHAAIGAQRYDELLRLRGLDLTASEVLDLGRSVAEEMRIELARLLRRSFKAQTAEAALGSARQNVPDNLHEAIVWTRELVDQARAFIGDNGVVPLPSSMGASASEALLVEAMPATMAPSGQAALYVPPPPYAAQNALLLLREPPGPQQDALKELSVADLEAIVGTMGFPGRHAQAVWQNRTTTIARRGALLGAGAGPASTWGLDMVHGWGLVAAELMRELSFRPSSAARLLMVRQTMTAALLAVADVDLAIGRMTPEETATFLVRRAGLRLPVARATVRTLLKAPTSGLSALVGKVRIEQLRREAHKRWRQGWSDKRFHGLLLVNGAVPLAYLFERLDEPATYVSDVVTASNANGDPAAH